MSETNTNPQVLTPSAEYSNSASTTSAPLNYAHFGYRLGAYLLDYFAIQIGLTIIGCLVMLPFLPSLISVFDKMAAATTPAQEDAIMVEFAPVMILMGLVVFLAMIISYWLYYALLDSSKFQGTLGKMALGLKVTDLNGNRISFLRATGRHFSMYISGMIFIGYLFPLWTEKKQTLHDLIAGCVVIRNNP